MSVTPKPPGAPQAVRGHSLWQVLLAYLGVSWAVLEALDLFSERYGLPTWLFTAALVLLAVGLVAVIAAALVGTRTVGASPEAAEPEPGQQAARQPLGTWARAGLVLLSVVALWGVVATGWLVASRGEAEALLTRGEVLSELERFRSSLHWDSAFFMTRAYQDELQGDSAFEAMRDMVTWSRDIEAEPAGARITLRLAGGDEWMEMGAAPIQAARLPRSLAVLRAEAEGYESVEILVTRRPLEPLRLAEVGGPFEGMVSVPGGEYRMEAPGLESLEPVLMDPSWIDRFEVTNAEYAAFVDAGGYTDPRYWTEPFRDGGRTMPFTEGVARLVDQSGLPGPSTWVGGDYPEGTANHPVGGVSWYEAAAYANYAGKRLPSVYHWNRAAGTGASSAIVPASNMEGRGPLPVGATTATSRSGARDMAGNVREWCWNRSGDNRYIMGGGWSDAPYMFADAYSQPAWDRSAINGIRLAIYEDSEHLASALRDIARPTRDFLAEEPISDERFATYRSLFAYDRTPLNVAIESDDSAHVDWIRQHVSFDAAYDGPRMEAVLFLPRGVEPPYQTVVLFPGSGALYDNDTDNVSADALDFVVKNGRAVVVPVYLGTFGRGGNELLDTDQPDESVAYRDVVVQWVRDLGRTLDYLETRPDLDMERAAYYGISWGARMGVLMLAVEPRFDAAVFYVGGLKHQRALPEADPASYVHRVTLPVLMLNGRYDHFFPLESSQIPMHELLGTPPEDKAHLVFDGGHSVPKHIRVRESLAWLDRYLGPVR